MLHFATLFDINYLSRGLALIHSLEQHCSIPFKVFVLSLDEQVPIHFKKNQNKNVLVIQLSEIETYFPDLLIAKANRKKVEYYFTLSPYLPSYLFEKYQEVQQITTLDADILFFSDPAIIFKTYPTASILITPHAFHKGIEYMCKWGIYNVSFQSFKRTEEAILCLDIWKKQCFDWCYDEIDLTGTKFADQKYLDDWPILYRSLCVINISSVGLAPWNIKNHIISTHNHKILVDGIPLVYYHFHGLRLITNNFITHSLDSYEAINSAENKAVQKIYHMYMLSLSNFQYFNLLETDNSIARYQVNGEGVLKKVITSNGVLFISKWMVFHFNLTKISYFIRMIFNKISSLAR